MIGVPAAFAAYTEVGTFAGSGSGPGGSGSGNGELFNPGQADVNDDTGYLYVADTGNDRVQVFKPNATGGEYDSQASVPGAVGLAIDQSNGDVYVATATGVSKFEDDLTPVASGWTDPAVTGPLAVDPSTGDLLVADTAGNLIRRFNSDGSADGTFAAERPVDLAADSTGDVLVVTSTGSLNSCGPTSAVERFSGAGVSEGTLAGLTVPGAVAVDPDDDSIAVATHVNEYFCELGNRPSVAFFSAAGTFTESVTLAPDTVYSAVPGLAVAGGDSARAYAVTKSPMNDSFGATKITALEEPPPVAPEIAGQSAQLRGTEVTLRAGIDAGGAETTYHFEYGTTAAYGQQTDEAILPAAFGNVQVKAMISGLIAGTTYHYRVVASNSEGEVEGLDRTFVPHAAPGSCPNEQFRTGLSAGLSDCRAYEFVNPPGTDARVRLGGGPATPDGNVVCFDSEDPLAGSDPNGMKTADDGYCAWRTPTGWQTKWVTGPAPSPEKRIAAVGANVYFLSPDGNRVAFATDGLVATPEFRDFLPPPGSAYFGTVSAFMWEGGSTRWVAPAPPPPAPQQAEELRGVGYGSPDNGGAFISRRPLAVSDDLTHGVFESSLGIVPEDENGSLDVYEWNPDEIRVVSIDPATGKAAGGLVPLQTFEQTAAFKGTISADGSRVFFEHTGVPLTDDNAPADVFSVYMREGDEMTLVSPRRGSGPDRNIEFAGASEDGNVVYLRTEQQLTADPKETGNAIYRYDVATDQLQLVATAPGGVQILNTSKNGETVVYLEEAGRELVVNRLGAPVELGTLEEGDVEETYRVASRHGITRRALRISPDGKAVVFAAASGLAGSATGPVKIFRWSSGEGLDWISLNETGDPPTANASIGAYPGPFGSPREELLLNHKEKALTGRVMSDDGSRVYFETSEALVARDVNGANDVYEWHDGEVNLISPGVGKASYYHENSADGKNVFFTSYGRVIPELDRNETRELYAAVSGGGYALPEPPPHCEGEGCQPTQPAPTVTAPDSRAAGEGNPAPPPRLLVFGKSQRDQLVDRGKTTITVAVAGPGRVTAALSGKVAGRTRIVARVGKAVKGAGETKLTLKLSKLARDQLQAGRVLQLTLELGHSNTDQITTRKVTLHG